MWSEEMVVSFNLLSSVTLLGAFCQINEYLHVPVCSNDKQICKAGYRTEFKMRAFVAGKCA